jgi:hypothetical protein
MAKPSAENEPSELDELTHVELRTMHGNAAAAILFAKGIQRGAVGFAIFVFTAAIFIDRAASPNHPLTGLLSVAIILFACGMIFLLFMYQMWQFNEIKRARMIETLFSSYCRKVNNIESRRERNVERYTMLVFKAAVVVGSAVIALMAIR